MYKTDQIELKHTTGKLILESDKGATAAECAQEAIRVAMEKWIEVIFIHNNQIYTVDPNELLKTVIDPENNIQRLQMCTYGIQVTG